MRYTPFRHLAAVARKKRPVQCTIFLTGKCNARCPFCFYLSRKTPVADGAEELSLAELDKIAASCGDLLWLAFSGGEIFLRNDLVAIARTFYEKSRPAFLLLPTNGLLPETIYRKTEEILKACPKSVVTVKLSLDGPANIHDGLRGVEGAFLKAMETYQQLSGLLGRYGNFELGINTVFCSVNQERMQDIIRFIAKLEHVKTHTVSLIRGALRHAELKNVCMESYQEAIGLLEENLKRGAAGQYSFSGGRLKAAQDILQRRLIHETLEQKRQVIPCYAGRLTVVVTESGDVFPCESFADKLGNLRQSGYDLQAVLRGRAAREKLAAIRKQHCYCTHECYFIMNILFNPALYPALFKEYLELGRRR